jgi:hypothetical protein
MNLATNGSQNFFSDFTGFDWLTTEEAAVYLRILTRTGKPSTHRLRNLVNTGRVPFYKPFGRLMFRSQSFCSLQF